MNLQRSHYLDELRFHSAYSGLRNTIRLFKILGFAFSGAIAVAFMLGGFFWIDLSSARQESRFLPLAPEDATHLHFTAFLHFVYGIVAGGFSTAVTLLVASAANAFADTVDCVIETSSRNLEMKFSWEK